MNIKVAQAYYYLDKISEENILSCARNEFKNWNKSPSLFLLVGMPKSGIKAAKETFGKALKELGVKKIKTKKEAALIIAKDISKKILSGDVDPYTGARKIWIEAWVTAEHPKELNGFVNDATDYEEKYPPDASILGSIKKEAKALIENS